MSSTSTHMINRAKFEGKIFPPRPPTKAEVNEVANDFYDTNIRDQGFEVMSRDYIDSFNCLGWVLGRYHWIGGASYFEDWQRLCRFMSKHGFEQCAEADAYAVIDVWGNRDDEGEPRALHFALKTEAYGWTSKLGYGVLIAHERNAFLAREEEDADGEYGYLVGHFKRVGGRAEEFPTVGEVAQLARCNCSTAACEDSCVVT